MGFARHFFLRKPPGGEYITWYPEIEEPIKSRKKKHYSELGCTLMAIIKRSIKKYRSGYLVPTVSELGKFGLIDKSYSCRMGQKILISHLPFSHQASWPVWIPHHSLRDQRERSRQ